MEMIAEQSIAASRERVWAALNDTEVLKASMPGCESFEAVGENTFAARITAKVGPVKAKFKFNVELSDIDPPNSYTINGEGQGGVAGFAKGSASVMLTEDGANTILAYRVKANVGGKLAQLGARLIDGIAKKMADEFFGNFVEIVTGAAESESNEQQQEVESTASPTNTATSSTNSDEFKSRRWVWIIALLVVSAMILRAFA